MNNIDNEKNIIVNENDDKKIVKKNKGKKIVRCASFLLILVILLYSLIYLFTPYWKGAIEGSRSTFINKIVNEKDDSLDVIFLGDSRLFCSISPITLYRDFGFTSFCVSQSIQTISESLTLFKTVLKKQKPKVLVLETNQLFDSDFNVLEAKFLSIVYKIYPAYQEHSNWKKWFSYEWTFDRDLGKGYAYSDFVDGCDDKLNLTPTKERAKINDDFISDVIEIGKLCVENNIEMMLLTIPSQNNWDYAKYNTICDIAKNNDLFYEDLNQPKEKVKIDWHTDTRDFGEHLNDKGATKVTDFIGGYMKKNFKLEDRREDKTGKYDTWKTDVKLYEEKFIVKKK